MAKLMVQPQSQSHFLLLTFPAQGHINPALQFAKRLLRLGVKVTLATCVSAHGPTTKASQDIPESLNFAVFSDGFDDGYDVNDYTSFMSQLKTRRSQSVKETILSFTKDGTPVTCLVHTLLLPWVAEVAGGLNVPSALLWIQPASVFRIYYYYFKGYDKLIVEGCDEPSWTIELPGLPLLKSRDLPSFCLPSNVHNFALPLFKGQLQALDSEDKPKILVNTFDALEEEALKEINDKMKLIAIGPLIPSAFLNEKDSSDTSFGGDLFESSKDYIEWMNTNPEGSIVYISFGSIIMSSKKQKEAMAHALLASRRPFLWVLRNKDEARRRRRRRRKEEEELISCKEELEELGLIVPWCSQLEVLSHPSLGCFVTHCGWNSTMESIVCGVPVVAIPHWTDQTTNAKLLEDEWRTGVRAAANEEGVVEGDEITRCIEMVMGVEEAGTEMRKNAKKWKDLAREAMKEGGSSHMNLKAFVEESNGSATQNKVIISSKESEPDSAT